MQMNSQLFILEDDPIIAWDIDAELKARGWQIVGVKANAADSHAILAEKQSDAAVLDINLGNENSFDVARDCVKRGIAVVFLSGESGDALPDDLKQLKICAKPVDYDRLHKTLMQELDAL